MYHVDHQVSLFVLAKSITVKSSSPCCCQFCFNLIIIQYDRIIPRFGNFIFMRKTRTITRARIFACARLKFYRTSRRHHQDIEQFATTTATQMGMTKTHDTIVGIMVSGTPVPAFIVGIRTELNHSKWNCGSREGMTMTGSSDHWIDIASQRRCGSIAFTATEQQPCYKEK